jgi:CheY-like chemotaxis protein
MSQRSQMTTFFLTNSEPRAWLVVRSDNEESRVLEMWQQYPNHWSTSTWLNPGKHHYRYYRGDDQHVFYFGPACLRGSECDEMDGLVSVELPRDTMNSHSINILLVEDNLTTLMALENLLKQDGYIVHVAEGYQTALEVAKTKRVDFAICDINLWDGDGCDLLLEMQKLQPLQGIAVTGYTLPEETDHYRDAGFAAVLKKPVHPSEITSAIALLNSVSSTNLPATEALGN